jgi:hypothetical protein
MFKDILRVWVGCLDLLDKPKSIFGFGGVLDKKLRGRKPPLRISVLSLNIIINIFNEKVNKI